MYNNPFKTTVNKVKKSDKVFVQGKWRFVDTNEILSNNLNMLTLTNRIGDGTPTKVIRMRPDMEIQIRTHRPVK